MFLEASSEIRSYLRGSRQFLSTSLQQFNLRSLQAYESSEACPMDYAQSF